MPDANPIDRLLGPYYVAHGVAPAARKQSSAHAPHVPRRHRAAASRGMPSERSSLGPASRQAAAAREAAARRPRCLRGALADFLERPLRNDYRGTGFIDGGRKQITGWLYRRWSTTCRTTGSSTSCQPGARHRGFQRRDRLARRGECQPDAADAGGAEHRAGVLGVNLKCASCHDSFVTTGRCPTLRPGRRLRRRAAGVVDAIADRQDRADEVPYPSSGADRRRRAAGRSG